MRELDNAPRKGGAFPNCAAAKPQGELVMIKTCGLTHLHLPGWLRNRTLIKASFRKFR
jgi:hypothetical protein